MTNREFYNAVIEANLSDEITEKATALIETLDKTNAHRAVKAAEKAAEKEAERTPLRNAIFACITAEPKTATTLIAEAGVELKPQAITSLLKPLVESGDVEKVDVKVKGKGTQRGYVRAQ